ncbi:hypothetical protein PDESU_04973 [Pontiella desulfatans]|uniref:Uncharacterized protein n=2 Tax=Pontiella desulfatans TaxID=2750659 RepID=A0A6C2U8E4_PONDE|nr:hypothetical protein PDESU_04973 [Pontiella desulfatans]
MCPKCLDDFDIPSSDPDSIKWSYRAIGPFGLPKSAYGAYSVLLTYRFFSTVLDGSTTAMMSFYATKEIEGKTHHLEADLGMLFEETQYLESKKRLILVECKSFNSFDKRDVDRMKKIGTEFPKSTIVFASLKDELSNNEITLLQPLVRNYRRKIKQGQQHNNILILTGIELFADSFGLSSAWEKASSKHKAYANHTHSDFCQLCERTHQLNLKMEPWSPHKNKANKQKI